jgi:uncharacterized membrane protein YhiD involved in acid resistance
MTAAALFWLTGAMGIASGLQRYVTALALTEK